MRKFEQITRAKLVTMVAQALPSPVAIDKTFITPHAAIYKNAAMRAPRATWSRSAVRLA